MAQTYDEMIGYEICRDGEQMITERSTFSNHCEEVARMVLPTYKNTFFPGSYNVMGQKNTQEQIDSTAMLALSRFAAILDSLLTPRNAQWHTLEASNPDLQKIRSVRLWFEDTTRRLFKLRYAPTANFSSQNQNVFQSLGAFGNGPMFIDRLSGARGFRYKAIPMGEIYFKENHQGIIDTSLRYFRMTAKQAVDQFGDKVPEAITKKNVPGSDQTMFWFYHMIRPRGQDYDARRLDAKGKKFASYYVAVEGKKLVSEGGYNTFPMPTSRYMEAPGVVYARGPAMMVLPAIKTLNVEKKIVLTQGHRTVSPVLLSHDDGITGFSMKPGALNPGGVNKDGRPMIQPLPVGNVMVGKDMMDDERAVINDAFLVNLFQVLLNNPKVMTATQVIEMANQKGILLAPTIGKQQSDYLGPMIERELSLGLDMGLFMPMPPELVEAQGEYEVVYTSPMSRLARAEENSGFIRSVESTLAIVNVTQDVSLLDTYDFEVAIPEMSVNNGTPERWMASAAKMAAKAEQRAAQQQQQADIQAGPAAAAMIKAQQGGKK
jgi:hypothetical protein